MNATLATLALVAVSLAVAALLRRALPPAGAWAPARVGEQLEALALKLLLPLFVFEAVRRADGSARLLLACAVGFALPVLCLAAMALYRRFFHVASLRAPGTHEMGFLAASFGGGNRGTALLVVLMSGAPDFDAQLQWFALVDLGNFAFLLAATPWLLARHYGARELPQDGPRGKLKAVVSSYLFATLVLVLLCLLLDAAWADFGRVLAVTAPARKTLFTLLVFVALGLRFRLGGGAAAMGRDFLAFALVRAMAAVAAFAVLLPWPAAQPLLLATGILLVMPPSSILPSLVARSAAPADAVAHVSSFAAASNVLYLLAMALTGIVALAR